MRIVIFCENKSFSGGRYYTLFVACALSLLGHKVTFVTDRLPIFVNDFKDVPGYNNIEWFIDHNCNYNLRGQDLVISVPKKVGMLGYKYSLEHGIPLYAIIFETPNFVSKYRKGDDSYEEYWKGYKEHLLHATKIITVSKESKKYIVEWINCNPNKIEIIHPCINNIEADKAKVTEIKDEIVTIGRFLDFKRVDDLLKVSEKLGKKYKINYITAEKDFYGTYTRIMTTAQSKKIPIQVFEKISDKQKFELIKQSKLLVHPSAFEGFGIPPAEALYCDKSVVVYDLPVYKNFYGNNIYYVPFQDIDTLATTIQFVIESYTNNCSKLSKKKLTYQRLVEDITNLFGKLNNIELEYTVKKISLEEF